MPVLGCDVQPEQIAELVQWLGLPFVRDGDDFLVTPPSWRFDIEIEEDLIEEIARLHGYDNIPAPAPRGNLKMMPQTEAQRPHGPRSPVAGRPRLSGSGQFRLCRGGVGG
jgi:phenylalanyl-tRNA synthetase beta chain